MIQPGLQIMNRMKRCLVMPLAVTAVFLSLNNAPAAPALVPGSPAPTEAQATSPIPLGGHIQFETTTWDFGKAESGEIVKYTFVFTNTHPSEVLEIRGVQPQCGCTTAGDYTKRVEPGKTGIIPIQFNTSSYFSAVVKFITVTTSDPDPARSTVMLQLKGTVWRPIEVTPAYAILTVPPDSPTTTTTVKVINNLDEPAYPISIESQNPSFHAELQTNTPGKEYSVTVSTVGQLTPGTVQGQVVLKFSSAKAPSATVLVFANVQQAIVVSPPQIVLPSGPLPNTVTNIITIQNNTTNSLLLSDPVVEGAGTVAQIRESTPGRVFVVTIPFPAGFEAQNQQAAFTVNSSSPNTPVIRVPIIQQPRPNPTAPQPSVPLPPKPTP
jgi:hypothetical protein